MAGEGGFYYEDFEGAVRSKLATRGPWGCVKTGVGLLVYLKATKVKVKRSNSHLSVCGAVTSDFAFPSEEASERSVVLEPSIFLKLARCRMYLTKIAIMQTLPTTQQQSTGCCCVSWVWYKLDGVESTVTYLGRK